MPIFILIVSIVAQFFTAFWALNLIKKTGRKNAWIFIAVALFLMGVRRSVTLVQAIYLGTEISLAAETVALIISLLMLCGVSMLGTIFEQITKLQSDTERELQKRCEAEEALRESEERFKNVLENLPGGIFTHDLDGDILMVNAQASKNSGYSKEELLSMKVWDVDPKAAAREDQNKIWQRLAIGESTTIESIHIRKDGTQYPVEIHLNAITLDERPVVLPVAFDISWRKQFEQALRESEQRFRTLFMESPISITIHDIDTGEIVYANPRAYASYGISSLEELQSRDIFMKTSPYSLTEAQAWIRKTANEGPQQFEWLNEDVYGQYFWEHVRLTTTTINEMKRVMATAIDITELKNTQEELQKSEERFRLVIDATNDGIWDWDINTHRVYYSPNYRQMLGYDSTEFPAHVQTWLDLVHPEDREKVYKANTDCIENLIESISIEFRMQTKNGDWKWIMGRGSAVERDRSGRATRMVGTHSDITERRQMEETIAYERDLSNSIIDSAPGIFYLLDENWQFLRWNKSFENITAYTAEEISNLSPGELFRGEDQKLMQECILQVFETGHGDAEAELVTQDERSIPYYFTGNKIIFDGKPCMLGMGIDVTERRQAEEDKLRLQSQLLQSQKQESIGRLAGGVAHDFNNMLVSILGYGEMLLNDFDLQEKQRERVDNIYQAGLRSRDLVQQLLDFSRKQPLKIEYINIDQLISNISKLLQKTLRDDIEIQYLLQGDLPSVQADRGQLEQMIINLALNAQDAMPSGGSISIGTALAELDEGYMEEHMELTPGHYVLLMIKDSGFGMDREIQEHIFEPFYTTKATGEGTGLGLASVYGIVKQHGGHIWTYSEPGQGTLFKIYLPASESINMPEDTSASEPGIDAPGQESICVVEDNDIVREMTVSILQEQGYKVFSTGNGSECLELIMDLDAPIDLLLTDVVMPDMNGKALSEQVKQRYPDVKVLFMSGYPESVLTHHDVLDQSLNFIQKPFSVQDLCVKLRKVLDRS